MMKLVARCIAPLVPIATLCTAAAATTAPTFSLSSQLSAASGETAGVFEDFQSASTIAGRGYTARTTYGDLVLTNAGVQYGFADASLDPDSSNKAAYFNTGYYDPDVGYYNKVLTFLNFEDRPDERAINTFSFDFRSASAPDLMVTVLNTAGQGSSFIADQIGATIYTGFLEGRLTISQSAGASIQQVIVRSGPQKLFIDNLAATSFTSVPEPAAWSMMFLGLGAVGTALRRRGLGNGAPPPRLSRRGPKQKVKAVRSRPALRGYSLASAVGPGGPGARGTG